MHGNLARGSKTPPRQSLTDRQTFNSQLTRDNRKRLHVSTGVQKLPVCDLQDLLASATNAQSKCQGRRSAFRRSLEVVIRAASHYAPSVDVVVQSEPHFASAVWGVLRLLLQIALAEIEAGDDIGAAIAIIAPQVARYEEEIRLFPTSERVKASISLLYANILNYLIRAKSYYSRSYFIRSSKAAFAGSRSKFHRILDTIQVAAVTVDREVRTAAEKLHAEDRVVGDQRARQAEAEFEKSQRFQNEFRAFTRRQDQLFSSNRSNIEDIAARQRESNREQKMLIQGLESQVLREQQASAIRWLQNGSSAPFTLPKREEGTGLWVLDHPTYRQWLQAEHPGIFWLHGKPGCGKTVLANYLAETAPTRFTLKHFFRSSVDWRSARSSSFAISLLGVLVQDSALREYDVFGTVVEKIQSLRGSFQSACECPLPTLLEPLNLLLEQVENFTLIVDALDECADSGDLDLLCDYLTKLGSWHGSRVMVFSRKLERFERKFQTALQVSICPAVVEPDIMLFLEREISRSPELCEIRPNILGKASTHCQGMFLWAKLMLDYLKDAYSVNEQRRRLSGVPPELYALYEQQIEVRGAVLDGSRKALRRRVFLLLAAAVESLSVQEISRALALDAATAFVDEGDLLRDPEAEVLRLCSPLVLVEDGHAQFVHLSVKDFFLRPQHEQPPPTPNNVSLTSKEPDAYLALKSLTELTQLEYRCWERSARLLRRHILAGSLYSEAADDDFDQCCDGGEGHSVFYRYACLHWHEHVTALSDLSDDILRLLSTFLMNIEFVFWSETLFDLQNRADLGPQAKVRATLQKWHKQLRPDVRERIPIKAYFSVPHQTVRKDFASKSKDRLLPCLPLIRLGDFFNVGGQTRDEHQTGFEYKRSVVQGLENILGPQNPLTLRARTSMLLEYFWQRRFDEAEKDLLEVSEAQLAVVGKITDYFITLQLLGLAQFHVTKFADSSSTLSHSAEGLRDLLGRTHPQFLMTELYHGYALEARAELDQAYAMYRDILDQWVPLMGPQHPLALMADCARGSVSRKRKEFAEAEKALTDTWGVRQSLFGLGSNTCIDSAIQLAVLYRELDRPAESLDLLDVIAPSSVFPADFERVCQVVHLRALIDFDGGLYEGPRLSLQDLLDQASGRERDKNNRELLWVRVDLADALRRHGERDAASMLFDDLVHPIEEGDASLRDEPESSFQLAIAERAVRLLKSADQAGADKLLSENGLTWVRKRDFYIMQGGPITDTASMRGVVRS